MGGLMVMVSAMGGEGLEERLAREMIKIVQGQSAVLELKERLHKHAMVNRCVWFTGFTLYFSDAYVLPYV